ncbi:MAG: LacI family transcriptional regulator [Ruminiclostridium sp.]|nr:LacI family transcriptional regulator [Ruminiclostridium sp.]
MASIKDIADKAGVSISTVSNVINGTKYVSNELKTKINKIIKELNYKVDPVARGLKSKKTMTIGVVITNINRIFFPQVIKGIQDAAAKHGYNLTFFNTDDKFEEEKRFVQMLESTWADGIILDSVADINDTGYFKYLSTLGSSKKSIPVVSLERRIENFGIGSVAVDNFHGGSIAVKHLMNCGCKRIVHITGPLNSCIAQDRRNGYRDELIKHGLDAGDERVVEGDYSPLSGYHAMKQILLAGIDVDGVFAANDQMAIGAIKAIRENGLMIPEGIKVVGFDNTFVASIVEPSLTTINVPKYKMGNAAVEMLVKRIEQDIEVPSLLELPINLIIRQSTDLRGDKNWDLYGW